MTLADWIFTAFVLVVIYVICRICMIRADAALSYGEEDEHGFYYTDEDLVTRQADHITVPIEHIRGEMARATIDQESWFLPRATDATTPLDVKPSL